LGKYISFAILLVIKAVSLVFFRLRGRDISGGPIPGRPWKKIRLIVFLNHTSLYEPLFAALVPNRFLWQIAKRAVVPVAQKTLERPIVGRFFQLLIPYPVSITREPDQTWTAVLRRTEDASMVIILPEGRMRRRTGLDRTGQPMTARGGVADILRAMDDGDLLMAYSGGLHHIQVPGQHLPKLFRTIRMNFELLDLREYKEEMLIRAERSGRRFKNLIKEDLDRRRDLHSPMTAESTRQPGPPGEAAASDAALE
jgi:1-acyl-sn-glycerol-3-phosphate acyltransferase